MSTSGSYVKGIVFLLLSALGFAIMSIFVKLSGDLPTIQKVFFRNSITMVISLALILYYKTPVFGNKESRKFLLLRSVLGVTGMILFFYAMDNMYLGDANMINKLSTFFLIIFSALFLKERVKPYQILAILTAFIVTLFIIKPSFNIDILPSILGVFAAICAGGAYTVLRYLGGKERFYTITMFFSTFSVIVLLPFLLYFYEPMSMLQLAYLLLAGLFASIGQFGITLAYRFAPAKDISIFNYFNVIFVTILSFFVFMDYPDIYSVIGYIVIFGSSLYIFIVKRKTVQS